MKRFKAGFTLAEVLITLSIIGIIAAIVMPSVVSTYQYKTIGVKLAKFMAATEQASRAYVVQDDSFSTWANNSGRLTTQANQFLNDSLLMTTVVGRELTLNEACPDSLPAAQLTTCRNNYNNRPDDRARQTNFSLGTTLKTSWAQTSKADFGSIDTQNAAATDSVAVLKDGTRVTAVPVASAAEMTAYNNVEGIQNLVNSSNMGAPVFAIKFDPNVSGLPETVHRSYWFNVTEMGYIIPSARDNCLVSIYNADFKTTTNLFSENGVCNNLSRTAN